MAGIRLTLLLVAVAGGLLVAGGCRSSGGDYPSLLPRPDEAPRALDAGPAAPVTLSPAERQALVDELAQAERARASAADEVARARAALAGPLAAARRAAPGSDAWAAAQLALSRLDQARAELAAILAGMQTMAILVDPLEADDPDRLAHDALRARLEADVAQAAALAEAAGRALAGV
ncbi:MAG: hypothetical protein SNJ63_00980 [Sphingomonadaceae bacterium]